MEPAERKVTVALSPRITIESLPAFLGRFRPLYDLLFMFIAPYIAWRRGERPDVICVNEFPLVWAAAAVRLAVGGRIELGLMTLPAQNAVFWGGKLPQILLPIARETCVAARRLIRRHQ